RTAALIADYEQLSGAVDSCDIVRAELALLTTFADVCELSRNRPTEDEKNSDDRVHSPREFFHGYLQSLDVEVGGLPDSFRARLARALRHYDVLELDRTPDLEEAV